MSDSKIDSFFVGVGGFVAAFALVAVILMIINASYRSGYEDGYQCSAYHLHCR